MKSTLFRRFDLNHSQNKPFGPALGKMLALNDGQIRALVQGLPALAASKTPAEQRPIMAKLEAQTGLSPVDIQPLVSLALFFVNALGDEDVRADRRDVWVEDLLSAGVFDNSLAPKFLQFISFLEGESLGQIEKSQRESKSEVGSLPFFQGASATVELRGVLKAEYKWGTDVENFVPEIASVVPVISIALVVDSGPTDSFSFQTTPENLQYLIDELRAAQKSAMALIRFSNGQES